MRRHLPISVLVLRLTGCGDDAGVAKTDDSMTSSSSSSSGGSSSGTTMESSGSDSSSTTGPMPCVSDEECTDAEAPFCGVTGECGTCEGASDPDGACAGVDPLLPLCVGDACVACTPENPLVCDEQLLLCDGTTNACVACVAHEECGSGACELAVGTCFPADVVVSVDDAGAVPMPDFTSVSAAVASIGDGGHGVIVVHELDGDAPYLGPVTIDGDKRIALLAAPGEAPIIQGTGGNPGISVQGAGTILYMEGLRVAGNTMGLGLQVNDAFAWVDRSRIVGNNGGGVLAQNGAELTLRNCFVGQAVSNIDALTIDGARATVVYSTLVGAFNAAALVCAVPMMVDVRNSILVTEGGTPPDEVDCLSATVIHSATEGVVGGATNAPVGAFPSGMAGDWFVNYTVGDYGLQNDGLTLFADVAQWQAGDPLTDIDGAPRPTIDGTPDYAGADVP